MKLQLLRYFSALLAAEIGSSLWLLLRSPADGPIYDYHSFLDYEAVRLLCWASLVAVAGILWLLANRGLGFTGPSNRANNETSKIARRPVLLVSYLALGLAIETLTSVLYWRTPKSEGVRNLYQSIWYWHRVPGQSDYGWPSSMGYLADHLTSWAVFFLAGLAACYVLNKKRMTSGESLPLSS
jgi:hypothetical protein